MTNLELLTAKIRKQVPRLMEITKGFLIKSKYYGVAELIYYDDEYYNYVFVDAKYQFRSCNEKDIEIIGHEPMLNDVLFWLKGVSTDIQSINIYGLFHDNNFIGVGNKIQWDLSKPYLKDQSKELIDYLLNLK